MNSHYFTTSSQLQVADTTTTAPSSVGKPVSVLQATEPVTPSSPVSVLVPPSSPDLNVLALILVVLIVIAKR